MGNLHQPVLLNETITLLGCRSGGVYVDGTIGEGGHAYREPDGCENHGGEGWDGLEDLEGN